MPWYSFTPGAATPNIGDANQYTFAGSTPPSCPSPNEQLCGLQAADNMGQPIITSALVLEIANALQRQTESSNVTLKPRP